MGWQPCQEKVPPTSTPIPCLAQLLWGWHSPVAASRGHSDWRRVGSQWEAQCKQSSSVSVLLSLHIQILKYFNPCLLAIQIILGVNNLIADFSIHCHVGLTILTKNPLPYRSTPSLTLCIYSTYSTGFSSWQASSNAPILVQHIKVAVHVLIFLLPVGESLILKLGFCRE